MQYLSAQEYAGKYGLKYARVLRLVKAGELPSFKSENGNFLIKIDEKEKMPELLERIEERLSDIVEALGDLAHEVKQGGKRK